MVVGDDDGDAAAIGIVNGFVGGDACVTGDEELHALVEKGLQERDFDAVGFCGAHGDVDR